MPIHRVTSKDIERTQTAVCGIMHNCMEIVLWQEFGLTKAKLERMDDYQLEPMAQLFAWQTLHRNTDDLFKKWMGGRIDHHFTVPILRPTKTSAEDILRDVGDHAATLSFSCECKALIDLYHFGAGRLQRFKDLTRQMYGEVNEISHEDGEDIALEQMRRAMQQVFPDETLTLVEPEDMTRGRAFEIDWAAINKRSQEIVAEELRKTRPLIPTAKPQGRVMPESIRKAQMLLEKMRSA